MNEIVTAGGDWYDYVSGVVYMKVFELLYIKDSRRLDTEKREKKMDKFERIVHNLSL